MLLSRSSISLALLSCSYSSHAPPSHSRSSRARAPLTLIPCSSRAQTPFVSLSCPRSSRAPLAHTHSSLVLLSHSSFLLPLVFLSYPRCFLSRSSRHTHSSRALLTLLLAPLVFVPLLVLLSRSHSLFVCLRDGRVCVCVCVCGCARARVVCESVCL